MLWEMAAAWEFAEESALLRKTIVTALSFTWRR